MSIIIIHTHSDTRRILNLHIIVKLTRFVDFGLTNIKFFIRNLLFQIDSKNQRAPVMYS